MNMRNIRKIIIFAYVIVFFFYLPNNASYLKINQVVGINNHYCNYNCDAKHDILENSDNCNLSLGLEYDKELLNYEI